MNNSAVYSNWLNADQWDGYTANRNRTLHHLYSNNIRNTAFLAGDLHANWVSDLVWLDETPYDQTTGAGAVGVEFAGTAVSSSGYGAGRSIANSSDR
ncbi:PhoD Phosphodiesterase-alkaline phosphatase D [Pyrenophora tritici-repentis]|nr:PhoD Phosphodiesterase-alkaline phosphatase D [Pyrenophora tritici-repentis]